MAEAMEEWEKEEEKREEKALEDEQTGQTGQAGQRVRGLLRARARAVVVQFHREGGEGPGSKGVVAAAEGRLSAST